MPQNCYKRIEGTKPHYTFIERIERVLMNFDLPKIILDTNMNYFIIIRIPTGI